MVKAKWLQLVDNAWENPRIALLEIEGKVSQALKTKFADSPYIVESLLHTFAIVTGRVWHSLNTDRANSDCNAFTTPVDCKDQLQFAFELHKLLVSCLSTSHLGFETFKLGVEFLEPETRSLWAFSCLLLGFSLAGRGKVSH